MPLKIFAIFLLMLVQTSAALAQPYGEPDREQPGDAMIQEYLAEEAGKLHAKFLVDVKSLKDWEQRREQYREEYLHMLGLWPVPEKTPLKATVTGTLAADGFVVEKLHYQSRPQLYVTANLYRPAEMNSGDRLPAVLYVCGHSSRGRSGNKAAFQSHGMWFARHGYICLIVDTLQLGEIAGIHHGTYREERWWWHSRGYTPAGVECWNGVRGIDYLISRPDVDPQRIAVTGISGGGAATFWIAAADKRVTVAVPVSGMADLPSYLGNRVINGHCDCMFLYNTFQWPWTRIAALIAPRPQLFANSDQDPIFPMDANERIINRLERIYSLYGAGDQVDALVSIGGHAYREDLRQGAYRFINTWLKQEPQVVTDSEVDLIAEADDDRLHPIPIEQLRVFPSDDDLPADQLNSTIDQHFVPMANVDAPDQGRYDQWKEELQGELRRVVFRYFPQRIEPARQIESLGDGRVFLETEQGIKIVLSSQKEAENRPGRVILIVDTSEQEQADQRGEWLDVQLEGGDTSYWCEPRGTGRTRWTTKNPPNYVERSHVLLGRTADTGRVWDLIATARFLKEKHPQSELWLAGEGAGAVLAAYAALWEPDVSGVIAHKPPTTHMDSEAPQFLNVLRVCDVPVMLGLLAPRPLILSAASQEAFQQTAEIYRSADAADDLQVVD